MVCILLCWRRLPIKLSLIKPKSEDWCLWSSANLCPKFSKSLLFGDLDSIYSKIRKALFNETEEFLNFLRNGNKIN